MSPKELKNGGAISLHLYPGHNVVTIKNGVEVNIPCRFYMCVFVTLIPAQ